MTVRTRDLDEARAVCGEHLYPRSMRLVEPGALINGSFAFLPLGAITFGDVRYGAAVSGSAGELGSYHVNVVRSGHFHAGQAGRPLSGGPGHAAVYEPVGETELHYASADCHLLATRVDRVALEGHLLALHGVRARGPIRFSGRLDVRQVPGSTFAELIGFLAAEIGDPDSLCQEPMVAAPLAEALMTALLATAEHQYRDRMEAHPPGRESPRGVARAAEAVRAEPRRPYTVAMLAEIAGTGPGPLRAAFRRQFGITPMAYVREVRLIAAHAELRAADPAQTTIGSVARHWGFARSSAFAARYRERFHVSPAATLHDHH